MDLKIIFELRKIIKEYNIAIIHSHIIVLAAYAYIASLGLNVKNILTHHGFSTYRRKKMDEIWENFLIPRLDMNIAVSDSFKKAIKR